MVKLIRTKNFKNFIPFCGSIKKKLGKDTGRFGLIIYGFYEYGAENSIGLDFHGVYQMRKCVEGNIPVKMRFQLTREETPTDPRIANWNKFSAAVAGWQSLTEIQKEVYNNRAKGKKLHGYNIYISEYMLS